MRDNLTTKFMYSSFCLQPYSFQSEHYFPKLLKSVPLSHHWPMAFCKFAARYCFRAVLGRLPCLTLATAPGCLLGYCALRRKVNVRTIIRLPLQIMRKNKGMYAFRSNKLYIQKFFQALKIHKMDLVNPQQKVILWLDTLQSDEKC